MSETRSPNTQPGSQDAGRGMRVIGDSDVARLFEEWRKGGAPKCPRDAMPLALSVDGATKSYRLICTGCGIASNWFEASGPGVTPGG